VRPGAVRACGRARRFNHTLSLDELSTKCTWTTLHTFGSSGVCSASAATAAVRPPRYLGAFLLVCLLADVLPLHTHLAYSFFVL
jgi:hypothetical protein